MNTFSFFFLFNKESRTALINGLKNIWFCLKNEGDLEIFETFSLKPVGNYYCHIMIPSILIDLY